MHPSLSCPKGCSTHIALCSPGGQAVALLPQGKMLSGACAGQSVQPSCWAQPLASSCGGAFIEDGEVMGYSSSPPPRIIATCGELLRQCGDFEQQLANR